MDPRTKSNEADGLDEDLFNFGELYAEDEESSSEEIDVEAGEYEDEDDEDDYLKGAEYEYEVGGLNCLWKPDRPSSFREFTGRCGTWLALNREQIASGITGKSNRVDVFSCLC